MYKDLETYLSIKENKDRVREGNNKSDRSNQRPNNDIGGHDKNSEFYFKYERMTQEDFQQRNGMLQLQFSRSVMSDSLQLHGSQHARPPCPSPTPGVYPNSYTLSW